MDSVWHKFEQEIVNHLNRVALTLTDSVDFPIEQTLSPPPDESLGDISSNIAFRLAKKAKMSPRDVADKLKSGIEGQSEIIDTINVAGAGFINFNINKNWFINATFKLIRIKDDAYGSWSFGAGQRALIEHTSVNPNKPWHMGHARNAVLGDVVGKLYKTVGYDTAIINYIDDLGRQVAATLWGVNNSFSYSNEKRDHELGKIYIDVNKKMDVDAKVEEEINETLSKMEHIGSDFAKKTRTIIEDCVSAQLETATKLNILYDYLVWESDIVGAKLLEETLDMLKEKKVAEIDDSEERKGCLVFRTGQKDLDDKVLVRSNGTAVYTAKDIAFQLWKFGLLQSTMNTQQFSIRADGQNLFTTAQEGKPFEIKHAERVVNVIGAEQKYPQKVVFLALKALGFEEEFKHSFHLAYEHVSLEEGNFSGRKGTWIGYDADSVIDKAVKQAYEEVESRNPDFDNMLKKEIADMVGKGAVRYTMIKTFPEKKITFRWKDVLDYNGETAPYIQYTYARACRIIEKGELGEANLTLLDEPAELKLLKGIAQYPDVVKKAALEVKPHIVANYAYRLASHFNDFYSKVPVLNAPDNVKYARLALVDTYRMVIKNVLGLLGIKAPERM